MSEWEWIVSFKSIWVFLEAFSPPKTIFFLPRSVSLRLPCQLCDLCSLLCSNLAQCLHWDGRRVNVGEVNVKKKRHSRSSLITSKCQRKKRFSFQFQSSDVNQRHHTIHTRLGWDEHMRNNYENKKTTQIQTRTKWKMNEKKKTNSYEKFVDFGGISREYLHSDSSLCAWIVLRLVICDGTHTDTIWHYTSGERKLIFLKLR